MNHPLTNWAGNVIFSATNTRTPTSILELQELVATNRQVRAIGTRHSFNRIADTNGCLVSTAGIPIGVDIDSDSMTARVGAGMTVGDIAEIIDSSGFALPNLGSLPHISIAGACATGTHGSGDSNRILAESVRSLDFITADGTCATISRGDPHFDGAIVSLGSIGIVTSMTLELRPTFNVQQTVYVGLDCVGIIEHLDELFSSAYSVSIFTDWLRHNQIWLKARVGDQAANPSPESFGAHPAERDLHPAPGVSPAHCTPQMGAPGAWHELLPHFRRDLRPSVGEELQSEYFVDRKVAADALRSIVEIQPILADVLQVSELRTVASDEFWISPASERASIAIHFTWISDPQAVEPVVRMVEEVLSPFNPRPHWGKVFTATPDTLRASYPHWDDFIRMCDHFDSARKFGNEFTSRFFGRGYSG
ncbi:FAD-binding protein [Streptomyces sp. NBC_01264]|uniref:FAD-binding protein n=1 Tax=Streptomyces sp. NBC_01264 TaxID=2903804 RepID=UPI002256EF8F|nr:FAD-binding protein [Streptomyces sp. NBC_01264]MCX4784392.1 FAD-binding protein [Streptomyces sp. NBC_01264]